MFYAGIMGSQELRGHHQAKIVRKILISTVLCRLYDFLSLKNDGNVPSKSYKQKKLSASLRATTKEIHNVRLNVIDI